MILVSGTKRSGTSMWMGALHAAGLPIVGTRFPRDWADSPLKAANPRGFWESTLRDGIWWQTNPDPKTGEFVRPEEVEDHGVKVLLPGLPRTDLAYIKRVIVTVREWRGYAASVARLHALERAAAGDEHAEAAAVPRFAHALEWWLENFVGLRDILLRRYPAHVTSYAAVLADPEAAMHETLGWLEVPGLDPVAAAKSIDPALQTRDPAPTPSDVPPEHAEVFDALYDRIHRGIPLDEAFVDRLNRTHAALAPLLHEHLRHAGAVRGGA